MKKVLILISAAAAMFAAASCVKETPVTPEPETTYTAVITAKADGAETKSVLDFDYGNSKSYWYGEENLSVLGANGNGFKFSAILNEAVAEAEFAYVGGSEFAETEVLAVYPEAPYDWNLKTKVVENVSIPVKQNPTPDTYALGAVPAIAYTNDISSPMEFKNLPALIRFTTKQTGAYKLSFETNGDEIVAGLFNVIYNNGNPYLQSVDGNSNKVVTLGDADFATDKAYYLAVAPQMYEKGFTIKFNGKTVKNITTPKELKRNYIYDLGELSIPEANTWGLVGDMTDWGESDKEDIKLVLENDFYVAKNVTLYKYNEFKFRGDNAWGLERTSSSTVSSNTETSVTAGSGNMKVAENGIYNIYLSKELDKCRFEMIDEIPAVQSTITINKQNDWEKVYIYAWVGEWKNKDWPGVEVNNSCVLPETVYGEKVNYVLNNGSGIQTVDLAHNNSEDLTVTLSSENNRFIVRSCNFGDNLYMYYWNLQNGGSGNSWPGDALAYDNIYGYHYFTMQNGMKDTNFNFIINNNKGTQTKDLWTYEGDNVIKSSNYITYTYLEEHKK